MKIAYITNQGAVSHIKVVTKEGENYKEMPYSECWLPTDSVRLYCMLNKIEKFYI